MAVMYENLARRAIGVQELFACLSRIRAPRFSADHIAQCALHLAELANHEDLIWDHLEACKDAAGWNRTQLSPRSFALASSDDALLRVNVWSPIKPHSAFRDYERALYGYNLAHNHDFHLLSVGYFGPGAQTELYRFDPDEADGSRPQRVELAKIGNAVLSKGSVIYYEKYADVHVQREPSALSISINLVFRHETHERDQLLFDIERSTVLGTAPFSQRARTARLAELTAVVSAAQSTQANHHSREPS
jgi:hypothetical protein